MLPPRSQPELALDRALAVAGASGSLPPAPRRFVPADFDARDWPAIAPALDALRARLDDPDADLERWLEDASELAAAIAQERACRFIRHTCATNDPEIEARLRSFQQEIQPRLKPAQDALDRAFFAHPRRPALPARHDIYLRALATDLDLFRAENVAREQRLDDLTLDYSKRMGALTVPFAGRRFTLSQMARFQDERDRPRREAAWRAAARALADQAEPLETLFDAMVAERDALARAADCPDYRAYAHRRLRRFDYTPDDCYRYHRAVREVAVPALVELRRRRRRALGLDRLRPWDLKVEPTDAPPLRPFETAAELIARARRVFRALDPELGDAFDLLADHGLLDLDDREHKAPGGYNCALEESRVPFIFGHVVGRNSDLRLLLHEAGHAFHTLAVREEPLLFYRHAPMEFNEVASFGMELLGHAHLGAFYTPEEQRRAFADKVTDVLGSLCWVAVIDGFQHWLYQHPRHTRAERRAYWAELLATHDPEVDISGLEEFYSVRWYRQQHVWRSPFYYIEYGLARLGALQIWARSLDDPADALARYRAALRLGGTRTLPELFAAAGARFDLGPGLMGELVERLMRFARE